MCTGQIPDHPAEQDTLAPNPNIRCSGWQFVQLEVNLPLFIVFSFSSLSSKSFRCTHSLLRSKSKSPLHRLWFPFTF